MVLRKIPQDACELRQIFRRQREYEFGTIAKIFVDGSGGVTRFRCNSAQRESARPFTRRDPTRSINNRRTIGGALTAFALNAAGGHFAHARMINDSSTKSGPLRDRQSTAAYLLGRIRMCRVEHPDRFVELGTDVFLLPLIRGDLRDHAGAQRGVDRLALARRLFIHLPNIDAETILIAVRIGNKGPHLRLRRKHCFLTCRRAIGNDGRIRLKTIPLRVGSADEERNEEKGRYTGPQHDLHSNNP